MKANLIRNHTRYFRMALIFLAVAALWLPSCSTVDPKVKHNYETGFVTIAPQAYNSESRSYDRPWPFGPESTQQ
jgi:hypothetical protein